MDFNQPIFHERELEKVAMHKMSQDVSEWDENSLYCGACDSVVHNDRQEWANCTPVCNYCGGKLEL